MLRLQFVDYAYTLCDHGAQSFFFKSTNDTVDSELASCYIEVEDLLPVLENSKLAKVRR